MNKVKVLIVDDSALTRSILKEIIGSDERIEIVGTATNPLIALNKIPTLKPDVLTLDLIMPKMDGLAFLEKLSKENPIPTIVISGNSPKDSKNAIQALELGAIDIIEKPNISTDEKYNEVKHLICEAIHTAHQSKPALKPAARKDFSFTSVKKLIKTNRTSKGEPSKEFYVIGSSTGGPRLLKSLFSKISGSISKGIVVAQHMPAGFTKSFAEKMNESSELNIVEGKDCERIESGKVIIIPGDYHGIIQKNENAFYVRMAKLEKVNRHRPSVDVLFHSAANVGAKAATAILLTGMGSDGAQGMKRLYDEGARTLAQDQDSCIVYGMPKSAIDLKAVREVVTPLNIVQIINKNG